MTDTLHPLILDLVEWVAREPRAYADALDVWRTSCPRLTVWEEAVDRGYVAHAFSEGERASVRVTPLGHAFLESNGRGAPPPGP